MKKMLMLLFLVAGICVLPVATHAATITEVAKVYMDGATDPNSETSTTGVSGYTWAYRDYINDSASPSQTITVIADQFGNFPVFDGNSMYVNGHDSVGVVAAANMEVDEGMQIAMGSGWAPTQNMIFEAWVQPDYINWSEDAKNIFNWSPIYRWWEIDNWCDAAGTSTAMAACQPYEGGNIRCNMAGNQYWYNAELDPSKALQPFVFSHVGLVWTYDSGSGNGTLDVYVNGDLGGSITGPIASTGVSTFPELIGVGNGMFSSVEDEDIFDDGCTGDQNFNNGFCGWIESFAISTFTGEFAGQHEFVLVDPQECGDIGTEYRTADFNQDCTVNFADFAGMAGEWLYEGM